MKFINCVVVLALLGSSNAITLRMGDDNDGVQHTQGGANIDTIVGKDVPEFALHQKKSKRDDEDSMAEAEQR